MERGGVVAVHAFEQDFLTVDIELRAFHLHGADAHFGVERHFVGTVLRLLNNVEGIEVRMLCAPEFRVVHGEGERLAEQRVGGFE